MEENIEALYKAFSDIPVETIADKYGNARFYFPEKNCDDLKDSFISKKFRMMVSGLDVHLFGSTFLYQKGANCVFDLSLMANPKLNYASTLIMMTSSFFKQVKALHFDFENN